MGIPDHLTCLLRNLYPGQEATVRTGHGTTDWFQIGKGVRQGCILSPCLFNLYAEYIMRNSRLEEAQAGIKIAGRNINHLSYAGRRQWHLTSVLLPGKSYGQRSLVGCCPWGRRETQLSDFTFTFHFHALEGEMATHCSVLAWRIPGTVEPGGLLSLGLHRVEHD